ncbi:uncharacterized protein CIMG_12742 [Coccidioides immitis RS]|uniref:Uncharacterized protein n=2 Tax=Coccidioides immitis TaxID=5501 RepID=J3KKA2_COCIM|nr:uncharacterized protein CIMG_12742 [Coccidioides immitis RS]EAS36586.3 hypothetical protein CIMG_12742 [Coccidioides immitis RS]KMP01951.1 hypothetical protein CIRG_02090 [Coccidioides immitis RMSCC 2394]
MPSPPRLLFLQPRPVMLWLPFPVPQQGSWVPWSQTTFTQLPPAATFAGSVLPGLPPHTGAQALSARERAWCREPIQRPVLIAGLDNPNQLAVRAQLREGILVTRAGAQPPPGQECSACKRAQQGYGNIVFAECISAGMGQRCEVRN